MIRGSSGGRVDRVVSVTAGSTDVFLEELSIWAKNSARDLDGNGDDAALLCDLARDYLGRPALTELTPGDLRELLLGVFPRKITVQDPEEASSIIPTMREVCWFLRDTGRIPPRKHDQLIRELDDIEPQFADAVMDPANWGMARTFTQAMIADGVDIGDQDAARRWIDEFNELPEAQRRALTSGQQSFLQLGLPGDGGPEFDADLDWEPDDEDTELDVAPVRLAPTSELAAAARACPLFASAQRLAGWLGPSRQLTATGALRLADARALIGELGIARHRAGAAGDVGDAAINDFMNRMDLEQLRSARDFVPLERLWITAQVAGLVEVEGRRARPGPRLAAVAHTGGNGDQDDAALQAWASAFFALVHPDFPATSGPLANLLQDELTGILTLLYAADQPIEMCELAEMTRSHLPGRLSWMLTLDGSEDLLEKAVSEVLAGPAEAGAVVLADGKAALSPLGVLGMRMILRAHGLDAPAIGDYADLGAADMLSAIARYDQADGAAELASWVERRTASEAAAELAAAVLAGTPVQRMAGVDALASLGQPGLDAARTLLDEPGVGALVAMWLESVGEDPEVEITVEDTLWVLVDMGAAMLDTMPPDEAVRHLAEDVPVADITGQIAQLWRVDHPQTLDVLTAFADHHPDRVIAKAARKAIFRARTGSAGRAAPPVPVPARERPDRPRRQRKSGKRKRRR